MFIKVPQNAASLQHSGCHGAGGRHVGMGTSCDKTGGLPAGGSLVQGPAWPLTNATCILKGRVLLPSPPQNDTNNIQRSLRRRRRLSARALTMALRAEVQDAGPLATGETELNIPNLGYSRFVKETEGRGENMRQGGPYWRIFLKSGGAGPQLGLYHCWRPGRQASPDLPVLLPLNCPPPSFL